MKNLKLSGLFLVLAITSVGCGGDDIFGTKCPSSGPALTSGTVSYSIVASQIVDSCNDPPLMPSEITGDYTIQTDTSNCAVTIKGSAGGTVGQGTAQSSSFQADFTEVVSEASIGGDCQYRRSKMSTVTVTDDKTVTIQYSETQDDFMNLPGKSCVPPAGGSCAIAYQLVLTKK